MDPPLAAEILALRDQLMPDGLAVVKRTYLEESGEVELAAARLTPRSRELLAELPLPRGTLQQPYERLVAAARKLGRNEARRAEILRSVNEGLMGTRASEAAAARNNWIRTVKTLLGVAELTLEDPALLERVCAPLDDALSRLGKTSTSSGSPPAEQPAPTEVPGEPEPVPVV